MVRRWWTFLAVVVSAALLVPAGAPPLRAQEAASGEQLSELRADGGFGDQSIGFDDVGPRHDFPRSQLKHQELPRDSPIEQRRQRSRRSPTRQVAGRRWVLKMMGPDEILQVRHIGRNRNHAHLRIGGHHCLLAGCSSDSIPVAGQDDITLFSIVHVETKSLHGIV